MHKHLYFLAKHGLCNSNCNGASVVDMHPSYDCYLGPKRACAIRLSKPGTCLSKAWVIVVGVVGVVGAVGVVGVVGGVGRHPLASQPASQPEDGGLLCPRHAHSSAWARWSCALRAAPHRASRLSYEQLPPVHRPRVPVRFLQSHKRRQRLYTRVRDPFAV
jgi:hypothetical protein